MFPTNTLGGDSNFLEPRYEKVKRITLVGKNLVWLDSSGGARSTSAESFESPTIGPSEQIEESAVGAERLRDAPLTQDQVVEVLEELPKTFTKDYEYGLGFAKKYRFIVEAVERLSDCSEILIETAHETAIDEGNGIFYISYEDFEKVRLSINRVTNTSQTAANSVNRANVYNQFAQRVGKPEVAVTMGRSPLRKQFTKLAQGDDDISNEDQDNILSALTNNAKTIAQENPEKLAKLRGDIELVTLDALIERFERMLSQNHKEAVWQEFLSENPFVLSIAFGHPIVMVQSQASVGGRRISGKGEKIADFLVKTDMTNNMAIVEIKTPKEKLLNARPYGEDVYTPSSRLSGAINQVLDQKYNLQRHIAQIKENSRDRDIQTYSVHCSLVVGTMPDGEDRQKSFELFRGNSKDVEIVTFDELLNKLRLLRVFLTE